MVFSRICAATAFSAFTSMKPKRLVICRPTKKLRHSGCFSPSELVLIDGLDREFMRHVDGIVGQVDLAVAHEDAAGSRAQHAGHGLDQGRLAGAVVADQPDDLVAADRHGDIAQRLHGTEEFLHALKADDV